MSNRSPEIAAFIAWKMNKGHISSGTAAQYETELQQFQRFLNDLEMGKVIWAMSRSDISLFLAQRGADNSPGWKTRRLAPIKEYSKYLQHEGLRLDDPTTGIQLAKGPRRAEALFALTRDEVKKLISAPSGRLGSRDKAIIYLFYSGLKRSEVLSLSIKDLLLEEKHVRVAGRMVPLTEEAVDAINAYMSTRPSTKARWLFLGRSNERMSSRQMWHIVKSYVDQCGLNERTTLETLRATYAVHAMEDGISYLDLIKALGTFNDDWLRDLTEHVRSNRRKAKAGITASRTILENSEYKVSSISDLLHEKVRESSLRHFEDGDYREAVLNGMLVLTEKIREKSNLDGDGVPLVSRVFKPESPILAFTEMRTISERDEHAGFHKILLGAFEGVRNPKSHRYVSDLTQETAAEYLVFISLLVRRVDQAIKMPLAAAPKA